MTTRPNPFISSVRVEASRTGGPHEYVSVWIRGQQVGTLCVGKGDGEPLAAILRGEGQPGAPVWAEVSAPPIRVEAVGPVEIHGSNPEPGGAWAFSDRPFHVDPSDPPTLMDVESPFAASAEVPFSARVQGPPLRLPGPWSTHERVLTPWMRGSLEVMRVSRPEPEGGPDLYDPATRTVLAHPAQKLAVQAFAREAGNAAPEAPAPERADIARTVTRRLHATMERDRVRFEARLHEPPFAVPRTRCPADFKPDAESLALASAIGLNEQQLARQVELFVSYWTQDGATLYDWQAQFRRRLKLDRYENARQNAIEDAWREEETIG